MARRLFATPFGFKIAENASLLSGTGEPGGDGGFEDDASIGSLYTRTDSTGDNLQIYFKISTSNNSPADWIQIATTNYVDSKLETLEVTSITTTPVTVDSELVDDYDSIFWLVTVYDEASENVKTSFTVWATHDGTSSADASSTSFTVSNYLDVNGGVDVSFDVVLEDSGASQTMSLQLSSSSLTLTALVRGILN